MAPDLLAHESGSLFQNDWLEFLRLWGTLDPRAALQFTEAHSGSKAADWQDAIVRGWITVDPAAAADWWITGAVDERKNLGGLIVSRWVETEWMAAAAWIKARVPSADQPGLAKAFASALAWHHPEEATSLVEAAHQRLFPPDFIETSVFQDLARTRPIEWVTSLRDTFTLGTQIIERLATEKDLPDPGGWFLWLMKPENLPSAVRTYQSAGFRNSDSLIAGLDRAAGPFAQWSRVDPEGASQWVAAQPAGELRDEAAGHLVLAIADEEPEAAAAWLQSISSTGQRHALYANWMMQRGANRSLDGHPIEALMKRDGFDADEIRRVEALKNTPLPPPDPLNP